MMSNKLFLGSIWRTQSAHSDTQLELECISKFTINRSFAGAPVKCNFFRSFLSLIRSDALRFHRSKRTA